MRNTMSEVQTHVGDCLRILGCRQHLELYHQGLCYSSIQFIIAGTMIWLEVYLA